MRKQGPQLRVSSLAAYAVTIAVEAERIATHNLNLSGVVRPVPAPLRAVVVTDAILEAGSRVAGVASPASARSGRRRVHSAGRQC